LLIILATHPIQYQVPIWKELARIGVDFEVWYLTAHGIHSTMDAGFGRAIQLDINLLNRYPYRFPEEHVPDSLSSFWRVRLPKCFRERIKSGLIDSILVLGWNVLAYWEAVFLANAHGVCVWLRGDSNDLKQDGVVKRPLKRLLIGNLFHRVDLFLTIGQANKRLYSSYGVNLSNMVSAPHCVDNQRFRNQAASLRQLRNALREAWCIPDNVFCVLFVGKFIPQKHPYDLIAALENLKRSHEGKKYIALFVGAGELEEQLRSACNVVFDYSRETRRANLNEESKATAAFAGFLDQSEISRAYVAADALVLPSNEETWGLVVNEAMASGLPCIVSDACGCAEDLVEPLDPALVYNAGDVSALADSIRHLTENPLSGHRIQNQIAGHDCSITAQRIKELHTVTIASSIQKTN
jgi:glycosyltransferase involved in cell wall biosynthesis